MNTLPQRTPLVSVGLCTYNSPEGFQRMLKSIISQTYENIEVIIGDNSTNNETHNIYQKYFSNDVRIKYYKHASDIGALGNFEFVRHEATGKYFMWAADDDYFDISFVEKAVSRMEKDDSAVSCWSRVNFLTPNDRTLHQPEKFDNQRIEGLNVVDALIALNMQHGWYEFYCLLRLEIARDIPINFKKSWGGDVIFLNFLRLKGQCLFLDEKLFFYSLGCVDCAEKHAYRSSRYNAYTNINPYLDQILKTFEVILNSSLDYFSKIKFIVVFLKQIISDDRNWLLTIGRYKIFPLMILSAKKNAFFYFLGCILFSCLINLRKVGCWLKSKTKKLLSATFPFFGRLYFRRFKKNTKSILLVEANQCHGEILPGYAKCFLDCGFHVDVLLQRSVNVEAPFCLMRDPKLRVLPVPNFCFTSNLFCKLIKYYNKIIFTSFYLYSYHSTCPEIFECIKSNSNKFLFVLHSTMHLTEDCDKYTFITLKKLNIALPKVAIINPNYFGELEDASKKLLSCKIKFAVVGEIQKTRRDYDLLSETIKKLERAGFKNFSIEIIGQSHEETPKSQFINTHGRLDFKDFYSVINSCHYILALLSTVNNDHSAYITAKTSGSFQLSYGFLKPIVVPCKYTENTHFTSENSVVYNCDSDLFSAMITCLTMGKIKYQQLVHCLEKTTLDIRKDSLNEARRITV